MQGRNRAGLLGGSIKRTIIILLLPLTHNCQAPTAFWAVPQRTRLFSIVHPFYCPLERFSFRVCSLFLAEIKDGTEGGSGSWEFFQSKRPSENNESAMAVCPAASSLC